MLSNFYVKVKLAYLAMEGFWAAAAKEPMTNALTNGEVCPPKMSIE